MNPNTYDSHIINILIQFFLDKNYMKVYHGRWDTWLISNNQMSEYFYLMLKTDLQLERLLSQARTQANLIKTSPLAGVMKEDD